MIRRNVLILASLTLVSRVLGLVRSILLANFLGTTFIADAFTIAFKIPNLLRRFVAEGSMTAAFIPVFSDVRQNASGTRERESLFLSRFYSIAFIALSVLCVLGIAAAPAVVRLLYSFADTPPETAVFLTRYLFSYILFISLAAITQGVLNANFRFAVPALSPIVLNVTVISAVFVLKGWIPDGIVLACLPKTAETLTNDPVLLNTAKAAFAFATGVLLGGILQFLVQLPSFFRLGYRLFFTLRFRDPRLLKIGKLMIPGLFGLGIYQINALVADPFVLAYLEDGCIAALNYSNRLLEFSLGIFVISLSTVILPNLAKNVSEQKMGDYLKLLVSSLKLVVFISVPATAGLICLRRPAISLLFESGLFNDRSVTLVSTALLYHAIGLTMIGLYRILSPAFYALKDTRTPVVAAAVSLAVNLLLCATLPPFLGIGGIALAATVASGANALFLILRIRNRVPGFRLRELWPPLWKSTAASLLMGGLLVLYGRAFFAEAAGRGTLLIRILSSIALGSIVYFAAAALLRMEETRLIRRKIRERLKR